LPIGFGPTQADAHPLGAGCPGGRRSADEGQPEHEDAPDSPMHDRFLRLLAASRRKRFDDFREA
jgi:hypothetical protein